jgi:D-inositol-3-phosphate glycosyltransferase
MNLGFYHGAAGTNHAGGIAVYTQQIAAALSRSHDVYLYTQRGELSSVVADAEITVIETPDFADHWCHAAGELSPLSRQDRTKCLMTQWVARHGVVDHMNDRLDVLFTYQFLDDLFLSNLVDVPTAYTFHRLSSVGIGAKLREAFSQTDVILANSDDTARAVETTFGHEIAEIVYPGYEAARFGPDAEPAIWSEDPIILFVGRLVESKGVYDLLEAVARLDGRQELHVVGSGAEEPGMRRRARELDVDDTVVFHGEVPHRELAGYHAGADVFCLPSHDESFGMANVEAMASGLPVVTTNLEGIKTYLANGENGLLSQTGSPQDLAATLSMVLDSPALRATLGAQAREDVRPFTWERQAQRLERFCYERFDVEKPSDRPAPVPISADGRQ